MHPAKLTFQALRIHLNQEFDEMRRGMRAAAEVMMDGGRLGVLTVSLCFPGLRPLSRIFQSRASDDTSCREPPAHTQPPPRVSLVYVDTRPHTHHGPREYQVKQVRHAHTHQGHRYKNDNHERHARTQHATCEHIRHGALTAKLSSPGQGAEYFGVKPSATHAHTRTKRNHNFYDSGDAHNCNASTIRKMPTAEVGWVLTPATLAGDGALLWLQPPRSQALQLGLKVITSLATKGIEKRTNA